jgi:hypothetical protein
MFRSLLLGERLEVFEYCEIVAVLYENLKVLAVKLTKLYYVRFLDLGKTLGVVLDFWVCENERIERF